MPTDSASGVTSKQQTHWQHWLIWGLAATFFLAEYFARVAPSVMVPNLMHSFNTNALGIGALSAMFYYAYIPMQIPVGAMVDALNTRWLLSAMALLCGLAACIFCSTQSFTIAASARLLLGFSAAFAFVGALKLAHSWFPQHRFGFLAGSTQALGMFGAAIGEGPVALLSKHLGWQATTLLIGLFLCFLALLMAIFIRDKQQHPRPVALGYLIKHSFDGIRDVIRQPTMWLNAVLIGCLYAPTQSFAELWGPSYLHSVYQLPRVHAGALCGLIFLGWAAGAPLTGWVSDRIGRRKPILWASCIASLCLMATILYTPGLNAQALAILLFCYGVSNVGVATSYTVAAEISPKGREGTAMGFTNMASISLGALLQPLIGFILDHSASGQHGLQHFSASDFHLAMLLLPACFVISIIACYFLPESCSS